MHETIHPDRAPGARRTFLRQSLALLAAPLALSILPAAFAVERPRGESGATADVRDKGARGDGKGDETAAFQRAIDALPTAGGVVTVPPGTYLIDATRSVRLRSGVHLQMDPAATLAAIPNASEHSAVVLVRNVSDVVITGGRIVGERSGHQGTTGEWGHGIDIRASQRVRLADVHVSDCWGDGVYIGAIGRGSSLIVSSDITLERVVADNNRRQGLSMTPCRRITISHCRFTGTHGTKPESGIDIEPQDWGTAEDITISDCVMSGNAGNGLELHRNVTGVVVKGCTIEDNRGNGVYASGPQGLSISASLIASNGLSGIALLRKTRRVDVIGNTIKGNRGRLKGRIRAMVSGAPTGQAGQLRVQETTRDVTLSGNTFSF